MPIIKSAKKRLKQNIKNRERNFPIRSKMKTVVKTTQDMISDGKIEEAKKQIKESIENKKTILEILFNCGFNTKSAFNNSFKKIEGVTPTQYRLSILN